MQGLAPGGHPTLKLRHSAHWSTLTRRFNRRQRICRYSTAQIHLTPDLVADYVQQQVQLADLTRGSPVTRVDPLLDGVINSVYGVHGDGWSVLLKQALPYVRAVGESFPLSRERMAVEAAAMDWLQQLCPQHVPQLLLYDPQQSVLAMSWVAPPHVKLVEAVQQGQIYLELAQLLTQLLGAYLTGTSAAAIGQEVHAAAVQRFQNAQIVTANAEVVLEHPFTPGHPSNHWSSPQLDAAVQALWADAQAMSEVAALQQLYRFNKEVLIHNDLHGGNILVGPGSLYLLDWEFATMGPAAFDLGSLLGNLMLACASLPHLPAPSNPCNITSSSSSSTTSIGDGAATGAGGTQGATGQELQQLRTQQREWLLEVMQDIWLGHTAWREQQASPQDHNNQQLLADSVGYAACAIIRQTIGMHHYATIRDLGNPEQRASCQAACLALGHQLLLRRHQLQDIHELLEVVQEHV